MKIPVMELGKSKKKTEIISVRDNAGSMGLIIKFNLKELLALVNKEASSGKTEG